MLSQNTSCVFFLSICFVANSGESALVYFLRGNFLCIGVFYWCYPSVREQVTCSGRQIIEICPEIFSKAEYAEKCEQK